MSSGNIVKLNIGGAIFQTSKSTLTKFDGFFKTMLETGNVPIDENFNASIFVDRSARQFDRILNFMRDGDIDLQKSSEDVKEIQKEAQFYGLAGLVKICSLEIEKRKNAGTSGNFEKIDADVKKTESSEAFVKLNIGGTIFETSKSTLTKLTGFFKTMLESDVPIAKDESGAILIDRSARHFDSILNYMRDGGIKLPESSVDVVEIQKEAQYYLLESLVAMSEAELQKRAIDSVTIVSNVKVLDTESEYLQKIADPVKPTLIIYYSVNSSGKAIKPDGFDFKEFFNRYSAKYDIYFRPFNRPADANLLHKTTDWSWSFHWSTGYTYGSFGKEQKYENYRYVDADPFATQLANAVGKFLKDNNIV